MALKQNVTLKDTINSSIYGVDVSVPVEKNIGDCYIKIVHIYGNKENLSFDAVYFINDTATINKVYSFVPTMEDNFIKQAYLYLKTLPEFADAIDC